MEVVFSSNDFSMLRVSHFQEITVQANLQMTKGIVMMTKKILISFTLGIVIGLFHLPVVLALQSGGEEVVIGDLKTGQILGKSFQDLILAFSFEAKEAYGVSGWTPAGVYADLLLGKKREAFLIKLKNSLKHDFHFKLSLHPNCGFFVADIRLKPGETKYLGTPVSKFQRLVEGCERKKN